MNTEKKIVFNHFYKIRHDLKRSYILAPTFVDGKYSEFVDAKWLSRIHPVYAMILSFFSKPIALQDAIKELSYFLDMIESDVENLIQPFINNYEIVMGNYGGTENFFPKNIIIDADKSFAPTIDYKPEQFAYNELDLRHDRFIVAPLTMVLMINNTCVTDCVYCYANKSVKSQMLSFDRIKEIIQEAKQLQFQDITITGGEFFLYWQWKELLDLLLENGFKESLISTKVPICEEDIIALKTYDIPVQISLDSVNPNKLVQILKVKSDYADNIKQTITFLDNHNIAFKVATVLTKYNDSIENLESLHNFLLDFKNLRKWDIRVGFKSMYSRGNFDEIRTSKESIVKINKWIADVKQYSSITIEATLDTGTRYFAEEGGSRNFRGSRCSANYSNIFVLPDGQVTLCEQMYWNPRFIIGDLTKQTIKEVWNSPHALELAFPKKESFRDASICKKCTIFDECYSYHNKCYVDVLKAYGDENWDFPDPRCKFAPQFINELNPL
ncbi:MAG: radical SAM protein [Prevotellaceae bacterium]|jgi:radical SAM protein with 4Fe4S-binding SPASM domain|nr:radical SAM protein [Prevotellaceae bacterium]